VIEPTPGRVLWYRPKADEVGEAGLTPDGNKPLAAHIAFVHSPTLINIMLIDARGCPHGRENVPLVEEGELPEGACTWMPYQKGQAAKADAPHRRSLRSSSRLRRSPRSSPTRPKASTRNCRRSPTLPPARIPPPRRRKHPRSLPQPQG
jgi:hypothetical protein